MIRVRGCTDRELSVVERRRLECQVSAVGGSYPTRVTRTGQSQARREERPGCGRCRRRAERRGREGGVVGGGMGAGGGDV